MIPYGDEKPYYLVVIVEINSKNIYISKQNFWTFLEFFKYRSSEESTRKISGIYSITNIFQAHCNKHLVCVLPWEEAKKCQYFDHF